MEPCLPFIDYFVPSIEEASEMAGASDPAAVAAHFQARGVGNVLLTLGGDGVYVAPEDGAPFHLPAFDIELVDTTGCGDSFTAGIVKGWDLRQSARFATAVAAKVAMGLGSDGRLTSFDDTRLAMETLPERPSNFHLAP